MKISEVSKRYARALFQLAKQQNRHEKIYDELSQLTKTFFEDETIRNFIRSPLMSSEDKDKMIEVSFQGREVSQEIISLIRLLAKNNRLMILEEVVTAYLLESDNDYGIARGTIRSAVPVSQSKISELEKIMSNVISKKVQLEARSSVSELGGIAVQVGGWTFDDTINSHLRRLNDDLKRRAN